MVGGHIVFDDFFHSFFIFFVIHVKVASVKYINGPFILVFVVVGVLVPPIQDVLSMFFNFFIWVTIIYESLVYMF